MTEQEIVGLFDDRSKYLEKIDLGDWEDDGKYQYRTDIVKHTPSGEFWAVHMSRSGSYFSGYEYDDKTANQVKCIIEVKESVTWVPIK